MKPFIVKEASTLSEFLNQALHGIKKLTLKNYLKHGSIFVNGKPISQFNFPVEPGDEVVVEKDYDAAMTNRFRASLKIIYEDETIIVIDKPPGLLTVATEKEKTHTAFYMVSEYLKSTRASERPGRYRGNAARFYGKSVFIVHRLDRDASGLLVLAKNANAKEFLQFNWHEFEKKYYAVVEGTPAEASGTISSYLKENSILRVISSDEKLPESKLAITAYRVHRTAEKRSLVEVTLKTGRKHQIRVHMAKIGCPILGDKDYGNGKLSRRLALHAFSLKIRHPETHKWMTFESKLPDEMFRLLTKEKKS